MVDAPDLYRALVTELGKGVTPARPARPLVVSSDLSPGRITIIFEGSDPLVLSRVDASELAALLKTVTDAAEVVEG